MLLPVPVPKFTLTVVGALIATYAIGVGWVGVFQSVVMMLIYVSCQSTWMILMRKKWVEEAGNHAQKRKRRIFICYRVANILHTAAMKAYKLMIPVYMTSAEVIIVSGFFLGIRLHDVMGFYITALASSLGVFCFLGLGVALVLAGRVTVLSCEFAELPYVQGTGIPLTKEDRCFLRSCQPMEFRVGATFTVTRDTFPTISQDIILGNLVNLLVGFN